MTIPARGGQLARVIKRTTLPNGWVVRTVQVPVPMYGGVYHTIVYRRDLDFAVEREERTHDEAEALWWHDALTTAHAGRASLPALKP